MITGLQLNNQRLWPLWDECFLQRNGTHTINTQIADEDKGHPARWIAQPSQHYLGDECIIQSTHNFLCLLRQEPGMTIQDWHTLVHFEYEKYHFPREVDDYLQQDILIIGLNKTFEKFCSNIILWENFSTLTFSQVNSKAHDFKTGLKTESSITKQYLEEMAHSSSCRWCGRAQHSAR